MTEEVGGASPRHSRREPGAQPLTLITLAGDELPIGVDPVGHASLRSFENAVLARLPHLGNASTLGCELQFVQTNTLQVLADPIQRCNQHQPEVLWHKGQLKGEVRVLRSRNDKIPPQAFSFCTEIRHVLVRTVSRCRRGCVAVLSTAANRPPARHSLLRAPSVGAKCYE